MKKLFFLFLRLIFLGIMVSVFNYTTILAQTQEIKPIDQEITITDLVIEEEQEALKIDMIFPLVQGLKDKQVEEKINQIIQEEIINFKNQLQTESEEYLKSAKSEEWEIRKYIATTYYIIHY